MEEITYAGAMHINGVMKLSGENLEGRESILYSRKKKKKTRKQNMLWLLLAPFDKIDRKEMNSEKN